MKRLLFIIVCCLLLNCNRKTTFIDLDKLKGEGVWKINKGGIYIYLYNEYILMNNPPQNKESLKKVMLDYRDSAGTNLKTLDKKYSLYNMTFYEKTSSTSKYINSKREYYVHDRDKLSLESKNYLGEISFERCKDDYTKWISTIFLVLKTDEYSVIESRTDTLKNECNTKRY